MDTRTPQLDARDQELSFLADHLLYCLHQIERENPYLLKDDQWMNFKIAAESEYLNPADTSGTILGLVYSAVVKFLKRIEEERSTLGTIHKVSGSKKPSSCLPDTFEIFTSEFSSERSKKDYFKDAVHGSAEAMIMGELPDGIDTVLPRHRVEVRDKVLEVLIYSRGDREAIMEIFQNANEGDPVNKEAMSSFVENLVEFDDEKLEMLADAVEVGTLTREVSALILECREAIAQEYGVNGRKQRQALARRICLAAKNRIFGTLRLIK